MTCEDAPTRGVELVLGLMRLKSLLRSGYLGHGSHQSRSLLVLVRRELFSKFTSKSLRENADLMPCQRYGVRSDLLEIQALRHYRLGSVSPIPVSKSKCAELLSRQWRQPLNQS